YAYDHGLNRSGNGCGASHGTSLTATPAGSPSSSDRSTGIPGMKRSCSLPEVLQSQLAGVECVELLERHHGVLPGREALQILGVLGRAAEIAALTLGERRLGLAAKHAA
ncbi:Pik3cb, partial [Symbiodinium microadriaticum]